ncbi:phosphatase PAP2 family protein [bacterium]|nr:MAG: phosphatase PAP2 family protein [bacterium]
MNAPHTARSLLRRAATQIGLPVLAVCLLTLFGLAKLTEDVFEQETHRFDVGALLWIHHFATAGADHIALGLTFLGNPIWVIAVIVVSFALLWLAGWRSEALMLLVACAGAFALDVGLKLSFRRERPALWPQLVSETSYSYPSGHALFSLVLYGFLAYVVASRFPRVAWLSYGGAGALVIGIGASRLYLGVHWPSDVMAGLAVGLLWLVTCIALLRSAGRAA